MSFWPKRPTYSKVDQTLSDQAGHILDRVIKSAICHMQCSQLLHLLWATTGNTYPQKSLSIRAAFLNISLSQSDYLATSDMPIRP